MTIKGDSFYQILKFLFSFLFSFAWQVADQICQAAAKVMRQVEEGIAHWLALGGGHVHELEAGAA